MPGHRHKVSGKPKKAVPMLAANMGESFQPIGNPKEQTPSSGDEKANSPKEMHLLLTKEKELLKDKGIQGGGHSTWEGRRIKRNRCCVQAAPHRSEPSVPWEIQIVCFLQGKGLFPNNRQRQDSDWPKNEAFASFDSLLARSKNGMLLEDLSQTWPFKKLPGPLRPGSF